MKKKTENSKKKRKEVFKSISSPEITNLPKETTNDALSIVVDAINSTAGGIVITDLEGVIRFANPAFCHMFEYVLDEIVGKDIAKLFSSGKIRKVVDILSLINQSGNSTEEFIVENKEGVVLFVEVSASNVTSVSGERIGRMASFIDITKRKMLEADLEKKMQDALDQIKVLTGILPICASCKKIRDDKGTWKQMEAYIAEHSEADFSHGICPECAKKLYPEFNK